MKTRLRYSSLSVASLFFLLVHGMAPRVCSQIGIYDTYILSLQGGFTKPVAMDAGEIGAGRHFGIGAYYILKPYMAIGGGLNYTVIENILIDDASSQLTLNMLTIMGTFRLKTRTQRDNISFFLDLSPGVTADVFENRKTGNDSNDYYGLLGELSIGTTMGAGMLKLSFTQPYLHKELMSWVNMSVGFSI